MTNLITATSNTTATTMSHLQIAELTGVRNDSVKRSIEGLVNRGVISNPHCVDGIKAANGVVPKIIHVTERDSYIVVAQLYPEFTAKLVDYWMAHRNEQPKVPTTFREALLLAAEMEAEKERLAEQVRLDAPKVETYDAIMSTERTWSLRDASKHIGFARQKDFIMLLKKNNHLHKDFNKATQKAIKAGYLVNVVNEFGGQCRVTFKGLEYFTRVFHERYVQYLTKSKQLELAALDTSDF